ncbi:ABC transporter substrate-binding protein [Candidatus Magnetomorum sp. HK-1]|nr:ABC transporter substrate-binding protein [Candidatus Magnetomorum sp. HK-1]
MRVKKLKGIYILAMAVCFICFIFGSAFSNDGVTETEIVLGQSCAMTGPAGALGTLMKAGLEAYFAKVNDTGGIHGKKIRLKSEDDGYEPNKAIVNTRKLLEQDKVFMLIGEVGTPTSKAVTPIIEQQKVPFFGPFTGAEFLRNPYKRYVVNVRGSYYQEMEKLASYLVDNKGFKKISCFYQNDGYGQAGLSGIKIALKKRSMELVSTGTYERNTLAVKGALMTIRKSKPDAVIMVGAYKPCAEFIKLAKKVGLQKSVFCNISFVGTDNLKNELGEAGQGCIISQVVTYPWDQSVPLVKEYQETMKKYKPQVKTGFVSLEGYMVAKLWCMILKETANITREDFLNTVSKIGKFDLGGIVLQYGPSDNQGMDKVFLTIIDGNDVKPLN